MISISWKKVFIFTLLALVVIAPLLVNVSFDFESEARSAIIGDTNLKEPKKTKTILMWNRGYNGNELGLGFGGPELFKDTLQCPEYNCLTTSNRSLLKSVDQFDAIVFHMLDFKRDKTLPKSRNRRQRYVFWVLESPAKNYVCRNFESFNGVFNWTMTYRYGFFNQVHDLQLCQGYHSLDGTRISSTLGATLIKPNQL